MERFRPERPPQSNRRVIAIAMGVGLFLSPGVAGGEIQAEGGSARERAQAAVINQSLAEISQLGSTVVIIEADATTLMSLSEETPRGSVRQLYQYGSFGMGAYEISSVADLTQIIGNPQVKAMYPRVRMETDMTLEQAPDNPRVPLPTNFAAIAQFTGMAATAQLFNVDLSKSEICIVDTAFDIDHPAYRDNIVAQSCHSATSQATKSLCNDGLTTDETSPNAASDANCGGQCDHGTPVTGAAAAMNTDVKLSLGKSATLYGKDSPGLNNADLLATLDWCARRKDGGNPVVAVNMSSSSYRAYGQPCNDVFFVEPFVRAFDALIKRGVSVFVAAGNGGDEEGIGSPGCAEIDDYGYEQDGLMPISASTMPFVASNGEVVPAHAAPFSNRSDMTTTYVPGEMIEVPITGGQFGYASGTSISSPFAALGGVILQAISSSSPGRLEQRLKNGGMYAKDGEKEFKIMNVLGSLRTYPDVPIQLHTISFPRIEQGSHP